MACETPAAPIPSRPELRRLRRFYDSLPVVECQGLCGNQCGPLIIKELELGAMLKALGGPIPHAPSTDCPLYQNGRCMAYQARPFICRIWGAIEGAWSCPHGCRVSRRLPPRDFARLYLELHALSPGARSFHQVFDPVVAAGGSFRVEDGQITLTIPEDALQGGEADALSRFLRQ